MIKIKSLDKIKKEIDPEMFYRPREVVKNKWITNYGKGKSDYYYILKLIKCLKIKAVDFGLSKTSYFRIKGEEIIRYLKTIN